MSNANPATAVATGTCPECEGQVTFTRRPLRAEVVVCASCAAELEVVTCDPLTLALAPEVEEDWGE